jgi:uncharacterized protein YkwD
MKYNNAKPVSFVRNWTCLLLMVLTACADSTSSSTASVNSSSPRLSVVNTRDLLKLHNQARTNGTRCSDGRRTVAPALIWNKRLARAANNHDQYMAKTNRHSHKGRNGSSFTTRIEQTGYQWLSASENIAYSYKSTESVMQAWLKS